MEVVLSLGAFMISFGVLFWVREMTFAGYAFVAVVDGEDDAYCSGRRLGGGGEAFDFQVCAHSKSRVLAALVVVPLLEAAMLVACWYTVGRSTLRAIGHYTVAVAVEHLDKTILKVLESQKFQQGNFHAAMRLQEEHYKRTIPDPTSFERTQDRVNSAISIAEFAWRFNALHPGEDPMMKVKQLLSVSEKEIRRCVEHHAALRTPRAAGATSRVSAESAAASVVSAATDGDGGEASEQSGAQLGKAADAAPWAYAGRSCDLREQAGRIQQYHAIVRMIYNPTDVHEHEAIEKYLGEAERIFRAIEGRSANAVELLCATLNSKGMFLAKQLSYDDATRVFKNALALRLQKLPDKPEGIAQAHVSLGNNLLKADAAQHASEALGFFQQAEAHYLRAYHRMHPKLAHAHEGIAKCLVELNRLREALEELDKAIRILDQRRGPNKHESKQLEDLKELKRRLREKVRARPSREKRAPQPARPQPARPHPRAPTPRAPTRAPPPAHRARRRGCWERSCRSILSCRTDEPTVHGTAALQGQQLHLEAHRQAAHERAWCISRGESEPRRFARGRRLAPSQRSGGASRLDRSGTVQTRCEGWLASAAQEACVVCHSRRRASGRFHNAGVAAVRGATVAARGHNRTPRLRGLGARGACRRRHADRRAERAGG